MALDDLTIRENAKLRATDLIPVLGWWNYNQRNNPQDACQPQFEGQVARLNMREERFLGALNYTYAVALVYFGVEAYSRFLG